MITDSYSASCYIDNYDGQYHMECDMTSGDKTAYTEYDGKNFVEGLNKMMDDLTKQMLKKPEPKEETPEEKIARLEDLVEQLKTEKETLNKTVESLVKKNNNDFEAKNVKTKKYKINSIDDMIEKYLDFVNESLDVK